MKRYSHLKRIETLDPERDHCEVMRLLAGHEFPFDFNRTLAEMTFVYSAASPKIIGLWFANGYLSAHTQKRYDDTLISLTELIKHGYDSERGRELFEHMARIHSHYKIRQKDYLFILTLLMLEPMRWNARFGWRPMCEVEKQSQFYFWREVGRRMGIEGIPDSLAACEAWNVQYAKEEFRRSQAAVDMTVPLFRLLESWIPWPLRLLVRPSMTALLPTEILPIFDLKPPPRWYVKLVATALRLRGRALRLLPARRDSALYCEGSLRSYPKGYELAQLGPPEDWHRRRRDEKN
jgi:hypothetical protein